VQLIPGTESFPDQRHLALEMFLPKWQPFPQCGANLMKTKLIKTESEHAAALARVEKLMEAKPGTPQGDELEVLSWLIHDYEGRVFPIDKPDPVAAIRFRMTQQTA
jgi:hypothetical protein